ncbi:L,D-transpeptidase [Nodosilinea sp. LEGE 07088]|nr:L,D-transpeptidase [Nodosilinea sp. LEGE 07088]
MRFQAGQYQWAGFLALLLGLPVPAIASSEAPSIAPSIVVAPARVEFEHVYDPSLPVPSYDYGLGQPSDYLPRAMPQADRIVLRLGERRVYVYDDEQMLESFPVAIGASNTPTPLGQFEIFQMIVNPVWQSPWTGEIFSPGPNSALGLRWIGFVELPGGIIGFHGTPTVDSIGQAASNGCVRLRNEDVLALYAHVSIGMTVVVEP